MLVLYQGLRWALLRKKNMSGLFHPGFGGIHALQLLHSFPIDTRLKDGSLFWQSPKRPPFPIQFDFNDPLHYSFILSTAKLFAVVYCVPFTEKYLSARKVAI
ncbi:Ubiquitin-like modifier-activating enzyme 6 [Varanus komodoensis]|nr:Ubiquitin-like modifier-activating enzyme 6 [Varanus komodoensis]